MHYVGLQTDESWVMASNIYLSGETSELLDSDDINYVWIGHVFNGPGDASSFEECKIELPLTTDPF